MRIEPHERRNVVALLVNLFLLLFGYYLLKTVREPLILGSSHGGAELKSYSSALQAVVLIGVSIAFAKLAERVDRVRLITIVTGFFAANLVVFYLLYAVLPQHRGLLGVTFFVWLGCYNMMIVTQFWAFANDVYTVAEGERLFPAIVAGGALGALVGARCAKPLLLWLGPEPLLLVAAGLLCCNVPLTRAVNRARSTSPPKPVARGPAFGLVFSDPYLRLVASLTLIKNCVNKTGEYILDRQLLAAARANHLHAGSAAIERFIGSFKSDYYTAINLIVLVLQVFVVTRLLRRLGVRRALFVAPILSLLSYSTMAALPYLVVVFAGKVAENSVDYSLQNTVEQTLFLVTSREAKYKAKMVIDTFLVRFGDVISAAVVWTGKLLRLPTIALLFLEIVLVLAWLAVVFKLSRAWSVKRAAAWRAS